MGTYIDAFIEIDHRDDSEPFSAVEQIHSLTDGSFILSRAYDVFDALAGGRESVMAAEDRDPSCQPLILPRGIPSPRSLTVSQRFLYLVDDPVDPAGPPDRNFWPKDRCVDPDEADEWVKTKDCFRAEVIQWFNGSRVWPAVSEPGFYNASWLWPREFDESLAHQNLTLAELPVDYSILRTAMVMAEDHYGKHRVRLVVWFS